VGTGCSGFLNRHRGACLEVRYSARGTSIPLTYRPSLIHEYRITKPSLHAAMSVGLETRSITEVLNRLSKIPLPAKLEARIKDWTSSYGKIRLVLKHNKYFLESSVPEFLRMLLNDPVIAPCKVIREDEEGQQVFGVERGQAARRDYFIPGTEEARRAERGEVGADGQVQRPGQGQRDDVIGAVIGIDQSQLPLSCYRIQADNQVTN
jgi:DNA excision repair protein ERCC-3